MSALGSYKHSVVVQRRTRASNGAGGWTHTWATLLTLRAKLTLKGDDESVIGNEVQAASRGTLEVVYGGTAITTADRIKFGSRYFGILSIPQPDQGPLTRRLLLNVEEREGEA